MTIGLIHNTAAGDALALDAITHTIRAHGHEVAAVATLADGVAALPLDRLDLVAAAGGDGTVAAVARGLAGRSVPLGVLAMGTANNIAVSVGVPTELDDAVSAWTRSHPRPFDLGVATGPWGERRFVESVGGGLVTHGIVVMDRQDTTSPTTAAQLDRAVQAHLDVLALLAAYPWSMTLDGEVVDGEYLMVEVLNITAVGPNLQFADGASPWDGRLTVVAATADDREALAQYLRERASGRTPSQPLLRTWHVREAIIGAGDRLHVDDDVVGEPGQPGTRIWLETGALRVLVPESPAPVAERAATSGLA